MEKKLYAYGLLLRPRGPMCQPKGYVDWVDFDDKCKLSSSKEVWCVLWYGRELSEKETHNFEMTRLEEEDK